MPALPPPQDFFGENDPPQSLRKNWEIGKKRGRLAKMLPIFYLFAYFKLEMGKKREIVLKVTYFLPSFSSMSYFFESWAPLFGPPLGGFHLQMPIYYLMLINDDQIEGKDTISGR